MLNFINSWIKGIIIAVIISTIIEMILPEGSIKKYVKCVMGLYIIYAIINPFISRKNKDFLEHNLFESSKIEATDTIAIDTDSYIEEVYIEKVKNEIQKNLEEMGYETIKIKIDIDNTQKNYGRIKTIDLRVINKQNRLSKVEKVEIYIGREENKAINDIEESEKETIKTFLSNNYGVEIQNIFINR